MIIYETSTTYICKIKFQVYLCFIVQLFKNKVTNPSLGFIVLRAVKNFSIIIREKNKTNRLKVVFGLKPFSILLGSIKIDISNIVFYKANNEVNYYIMLQKKS